MATTELACYNTPQRVRGVFPRLLRLLNNYLDSGQPGRAPIEIRYVNIITLIGVPDILASVFIEHAVGNDSMAHFMAFVALCAVVNVILLRKTQNGALASTMVLLVLLVMLSLMLLDGMFQNTAPIWYATFPAVAFFFKGMRGGLVWLGALLAVLLLIMLGQGVGLLSSPFSNSALMLLFASTVTVGMMVGVYEGMRARAEASLNEAREELHHLAHTDALTGLPNRTAFYDYLSQALAVAELNAEKLMVMFIDLDNFKPVNDTYGHEVGDQLLVDAASRLREKLRASDYIARIGGDEFVVVLPGIRLQEEVDPVAEKLISALAAPFFIQGHKCQIGVSIGIGLYPLCASSPDELVQLADHAMYQVKLTGKNGYASCPFVEGASKLPYKGECRCNRSCQSPPAV